MSRSSSGSERGLELLDWINDQLTIMGEAFGEKWTEERQEIYCAGLADIGQGRLAVAFRRARYELKWFPKLAELRELAGALSGGPRDDRPGPEEAWARMPKGGRMEEDSVVWCDEERAAYGACRSLLMDGDQIGARMAFKERYERELADARSQERPVRWTVSAGYDIEHRLSTLAAAIEGNRISLSSALNFVPEERRDGFAGLLPGPHARMTLAGKVEKVPDLPGFPGIIEKMRMEGTLPDELRPAPKRQLASGSELSPEGRRSRREELRAQVDFLKRSRAGSGDGSV